MVNLFDLQKRVDEAKRSMKRAIKDGYTVRLKAEGMKYYLDIIEELETLLMASERKDKFFRTPGETIFDLHNRVYGFYDGRDKDRVTIEECLQFGEEYCRNGYHARSNPPFQPGIKHSENI